MHQKAPKKSNRVADLDREPARKFYLNQFFWYFDDGVLKWKRHYLKVQMGKRRSHGWIKDGRKITAKIRSRSMNKVGARKTTWKWNCPQAKKGRFFLCKTKWFNHIGIFIEKFFSHVLEKGILKRWKILWDISFEQSSPQIIWSTKKRSPFLYLNDFIFFINAQKKRVFLIYMIDNSSTWWGA